MPLAPLAAAAAAVPMLLMAGAPARVELLAALRDAKDPAACLSLRQVTYGPGQGSPSHSHDATVIAYVLRGAVQSQVDDGPLRTYRAGEHWVEAPGARHRVSRNASARRPATFLAIMLAHRGAAEAASCAD